jgi:Protein of unknown function (DUF3099)
VALTRRGTPAHDVQSITTAPRSQTDDLNARFVKYTVSMTIRFVCIVLAFVLSGPLQWIAIAGAIVLPYVAVVIANAGREQARPVPETLTASAALRGLPAPAAPADDTTSARP